MPFVLEGMILGILASLTSFFAQSWLYSTIEAIIIRDYSGLFSVIPFSQLSTELLAGFCLIGVVTGIVGSCISIGKHMEKEEF